MINIHEPHFTVYKVSSEKPIPGQKGRARFATDNAEEEILPVKLSVGWRELLAFYAAPAGMQSCRFLHTKPDLLCQSRKRPLLYV